MTFSALQDSDYTCESSESAIPLICACLGGLELIALVALFVHVKRNRYLASLGSRKASMVLVLPIYHYVFNYTVIAGIIVAIDNILSMFYGFLLLFWIKYFLYRMCAEALSLFLMHNGVGENALKRSMRLSLLLTLSFLGIQIILFYLFGYGGFLLAAISQFTVIIIAYSLLWLAPVNLIHRRPAAVRYARYYTITCVLLFVALCLIAFDKSSTCGAQLTLCAMDIIQPFIILRALSEDSKFWQGLVTTDDESSLNQPLIGVWDQFGRNTVSIIVDTINVLEREVVPIIPFGMINMDASNFFAGGAARVYKGRVKGQEVALKILFCMELTPSRVSDFCNEATKLYSLRSPNIVNCMGVAIMPPALCLVTEFCTYGSLFDFLHGEKDHDFITLIEETFKEIYLVKARKKHKVVEALQGLFQPTTEDKQIKPWEEYQKDLSTNNPLSVSIGKSRARSYDGSLHKKSASDFQNSLKIGESLRPSSKSLYAANQVPPGDYDEKYGIIEKFKSAASVFRSKLMGFGLGPADAVKVYDARSGRRSQISNDDSISQQSVGQLLLSTSESNSFSSKDGAVSTPENSRHQFRSKSLTSIGRGISNRIRIKLAHDCIAGVAFLHSKGLMHCDIKSLNFLVTGNLVVKLSDLGEARSSDNLRGSEIKLLPVNINWAAPELLREDYHGIINNKSDIWSLTMVVAEIFSGEVPFDRNEHRGLMIPQFLEKIEYGLRPDISAGLTQDFPGIMKMLFQGWAFEPEDRLAADKLLQLLLVSSITH